MREIAYLVSAKDARHFTWHAPNKILHRDEKNEGLASQCDQFWYARTLVWLNTRKALEKKRLTKQPALASFFAEGGKEFFAMQIPAEASEARMEFQFASKAKKVEFTTFRAVLENP